MQILIGMLAFKVMCTHILYQVVDSSQSVRSVPWLLLNRKKWSLQSADPLLTYTRLLRFWVMLLFLLILGVMFVSQGRGAPDNPVIDVNCIVSYQNQTAGLVPDSVSLLPIDYTVSASGASTSQHTDSQQKSHIPEGLSWNPLDLSHDGVDITELLKQCRWRLPP